ncbi:MAG: hypothetical protein U0667_08770 [Chloroflexota bacterium]
MTIVGSAVGAAPITSLELWQDDVLVGSTDLRVARATAETRWTWRPSATGQQTLFVRGIDAVGRQALSGVLRVRVMRARGSAAGVRSRQVDARPSQGTPSVAAPPGPDVTVVGCHLRIRPGERDAAPGGSIHLLSPGAARFDRVATFGAVSGDTTYDMPAVAGVSLLVASAFDDATEVYGQPVRIVVPAGCGRAGWTGDLRMTGGTIVLPRAVDGAFLYLQADDGEAIRIPAQDGTFLVPIGRRLDIADRLPRIDASTITIEAWGWTGGRLVELGRGRWEPPPVTTPQPANGPLVQLAGPGLAGILGVPTTTTLDWQVRAKGGEFAEELAREGALEWPTDPPGGAVTRRLKWATQLSDVSSLVWQILPYAPPGSANLDPPFVLDSWSEAVPPGVTTGVTTIDFGLYLASPVSVASVSAGMGVPQGGPLAGTPVFPGTTPPPVSGQVVSAGPQTVVDQVTPTVPVGFSGSFWVRVIPMAGAVPYPPSNTVLFVVEPPGEGLSFSLPPWYETANPGVFELEWTLTMPEPADPQYTACAVVTGFTDDYQPPPAIWPWSYKVGKVLCPNPPSDGGWSLLDAFEAAASFVADVWDEVSSSYAWIKQQVVSLALTAVPCQAIADDSTCETLATLAVDAVAVGFGVPPSIPDFESTMAAAKGDVVDFIVKHAADQFPAVAAACGLASAGNVVSEDLATCEELASIAADAAIEQVIAARSDAAGAATGKAYPGVIFAPDPRGQWQPPSVTVTLVRTTDPNVPKVCTLGASIASSLADWTWPELLFHPDGQGYPATASGTVSGSPLQTTYLTLPPMQPGETLTRTLWLTTPTTWFESQASFKYWYYYQALGQPNRSWVLLTQGAELTFSVTSNCATGSSQGPFTLTTSATGP